MVAGRAATTGAPVAVETLGFLAAIPKPSLLATVPQGRQPTGGWRGLHTGETQ